MRIAAVLHDASSDHDSAPLLPTPALERDGALYRIADLAAALGPRGARLAAGGDFHSAVIAAGGASLRELDERLRSGERPAEARVLPSTFTWLPPCDPDRAALVLCDAPMDAKRPAVRLGSARSLLGHEATVPCDPGARDVAMEASVVAMIADDLFRAAEAEASAAIFGYAVMLAFEGGFGAQLGPVLVTRDEVPHVTELRAHVRVEGAALGGCALAASPFTPAEQIAFASHVVPLRAGDLIRVARVHTPLASRVAFGARVEVAVERLGRLAGKASIGPEMRGWRKS
ncbi:MAG: fumarylacetoacetate hydrolase family protein [Polyangiaceae bacterium]